MVDGGVSPAGPGSQASPEAVPSSPSVSIPDAFDPVAFGARIKGLRTLRRMSLQEVGDAAGFTKSHVWELETGRARNPTVRAIWSLARALGVSPGHILGLEPGVPSLHSTALEVACLVDRALRPAQVRPIRIEGSCSNPDRSDPLTTRIETACELIRESRYHLRLDDAAMAYHNRASYFLDPASAVSARSGETAGLAPHVASAAGAAGDAQ